MTCNIALEIKNVRHYIEEPQQFPAHSFTVAVRDGDVVHQVKFNRGRWSCDCASFRGIGVCRHIEETFRDMRNGKPNVPPVCQKSTRSC